MTVIQEGKHGAETVFENSPKKTQADVRHEIVPEIRAASQLLKEPETVHKLREVNKKITLEDEKWKGKVFNGSPAYSPTKRSYSSVDDESTYRACIDSSPLLGVKRKIHPYHRPVSPIQQRIRAHARENEPLMSSRVDSRVTWVQWLLQLICCKS